MNISIFSIDLLQVYQQKYPPPLIPPRGEVNAADAFDIGSFDEEDTKGTKYYEEKKNVRNISKIIFKKTQKLKGKKDSHNKTQK